MGITVDTSELCDCFATQCCNFLNNCCCGGCSPGTCTNTEASFHAQDFHVQDLQESKKGIFFRKSNAVIGINKNKLLKYLKLR